MRNIIYLENPLSRPDDVVYTGGPYHETVVLFEHPIIQTYHELWHELHTEVRTKEQFENWVSRVPSMGCSCSSWLKSYVRDNPYPVDNVQPEVLAGLRTRYGWKLHNKVNEKLRAEGKDRPEFTWSEFCEKYPQE